MNFATIAAIALSVSSVPSAFLEDYRAAFSALNSFAPTPELEKASYDFAQTYCAAKQEYGAPEVERLIVDAISAHSSNEAESELLVNLLVPATVAADTTICP